MSAGLIALMLSACGVDRDAPASFDDLPGPTYVGQAVCASCHENKARQWRGSDHDLAMQIASPETVLGNFENATFSECGVQTRFFQQNDTLFVETEGPGGELRVYPVRYTFGHDPLQQVLLPLPGGRLQAFTIAWDANAGEWFSLYPDECAKPGSYTHWTGKGMNWNYMCADCHSTNVQRNFELRTDTYATNFSEIDVSCEACHGPGERHVALARSGRYREAAAGPDASGGDAPDSGRDAAAWGLTVDLSVGETSMEAVRHRIGGSTPGQKADGATGTGFASTRSQIETCAPCHSRRRIVASDFEPGKAYLDHFEPELLDEGLYFADGQIRDEVYVYGSFLQSKMHQAGVVCSDCHDPHSTELKLSGNALCTQCHEAQAYDTFAHIRHPSGAEGSACVDCHMPERTYMVVDPRRDHSFRIPRPDLTAEIGTPNACSGCHTGQSAEWAATQLEEWHGPARPESFARAFAGGRAGKQEAEPELIQIVEDDERPAIVRATALALLDRYPTVRATRTAEHALKDPEPLVRARAIRNLDQEVNRPSASAIEPLLQDPVRLVRTEAARVLTLIAPGRFAKGDGAAGPYWDALAEYQESQMAVADQAAAHLNLAVMQEQLGKLDEAEAAYQDAIRMDSSFVPAHVNLAMLHNRQRLAATESDRPEEAARRFSEAERALRRAIRLQPDLAEPHYSLGLLLAEQPDRFDEAAAELTRAAQLDASNARMQYNAGIAQQTLGKAAEAERLLLQAYRLAPDNPDYVDALSIFYAQREQWAEALRYTDLLVNAFPENADYLRRRTYIQSRM